MAEELESWSRPEEAIELLMQEVGRTRVKFAIRQQLERANPGKIHRALSSIPVDTFVTTNVDTLLEEALVGAGRTPQLVVSEEDLRSAKEAQPVVMKLHGSIDAPGEFILTGPSFHYALRGGLWESYLSAQFATKAALFVGYSLHHDFVQFYEMFGRYTERSDWVVLGPETDLLAQKLWRGRGVQTLVSAPDGIPDLLKRISTSRKPVVRAGKSGKRAVFISHGFDGSKRLQVVKNAVAEAGLEPLTAADSFRAGMLILESLETIVKDVDFAIVLLSSDDMVLSGQFSAVPSRQNRLFELGLLIGALGRDRVLLVIDSSSRLLPSDLSGIAVLVTEASDSRMLSERVSRWLNR